MFIVKSRPRDEQISEMGRFSTREKAERFMMQQVEIMKGYNLSHWINDLNNRCNKRSPVTHHMVDHDQMTQSVYWIEKVKNERN